MLRKIREDLDRREEGFTLIELLVVVIIIGILAAIAIPVFLNQRKKAWDAAVKSDLKNAATAQESYFADNSSYANGVTAADNTGSLGGTEGFNKGNNVTFHELVGTTSSYCMTAFHTSNAAKYFYISSDTGEPVVGDNDNC